MWRPGIGNDPLDGRDLAHRLRRVVVVALSVTWLLGVGETLAQPLYYPLWFAVAAQVLLAVPLVVGIAFWRSPRHTLTALRVFVIVAMAVGVALVMMPREGHGLGAYTPLAYVLAVGMDVVGVVLMPPLGIPIVIVDVVALVIRRAELIGVVQGLSQGILVGTGGFVAFIVARALRAEVTRVERAAALTERRRHQAALGRERIWLRERWDALIHDTVLASLTLAARGDQAAARDLADRALEQLAGHRPSDHDPLRTVRAHAGRLGLDIDVRGPDWPTGPAGEPLEMAVCEVLSNVARHSGRTAAALTSRIEGDALEVTIVDGGRGFDPSQVSERRLGLRTSVQSSLEAVGGRAEVRSRPGSGTSVILRVPLVDPEPAADSRERQWRVRSLAAAFVLAAIQIASATVIGVMYVHSQTVPGLSIVGMVLIPLVTLAIAAVPTRDPWWSTAAVAVALVWAAQLANLRSPQILDYRTWFISAFDPAVVIIAVRERMRTALAVTATATAIGSITLLLRGQFALLPLVDATYQTVIWGVCAGYLRQFMDRTSRQVADEAAAQAGVERGRALERARDEEISRRQASLDGEVVPMLQRIAAGERLSPKERAVCSLLQSTTRDRLVAESLLTADLTASIRAARERRVTVAIAGRRVDGADLADFHRVAAAMLDRARPHDRVQLSWRSSPRGQVGSACLIGPGAGSLWSVWAAPLADVGDHAVSVDEDSVLVEFADGGTAAVKEGGSSVGSRARRRAGMVVATAPAGPEPHEPGPAA